MVTAVNMPVVPSSASVGRYSYTPSSYPSYRSSYVNRTTSLDRTAYGSTTSSKDTSSSGYSSSYSTYTSKYSRPPRPSYSSTTDCYRSTRSSRVSPVRASSTYSGRISSDSRVSSKESNGEGKYSSRYRDSSVSKDSGYGSRLTSRDRSIDVTNGNIDVSSFGPSPSSYAFNYRWDSRIGSKTYGDEPISPLITGLPAGKEPDTADEDKIKVSDRIRSFEPKSPVEVREHELESIARRRQRLGLSPARETKSRTPQRKSPDTTSRYKSSNDQESRLSERRPSVTDLCRKYDTNHNSMSNGINKSDEEETNNYSSNYTSSITSPKEEVTVLRPGSPILLSRNRKHLESSRSEQRDSPSVPKEIVSSRLESPARARNDSPCNARLSSPATSAKETPSKTRLESPVLRSGSPSTITNNVETETTSSTQLNGTVEKPKTKTVEIDTTTDAYSGLSSRTRNRRDRVRDRIAARLAAEVEDENGSPPPRRRSPTGGSNGSSGSFSENNGLVGLRNIGNTCFLNSITQCLSNTRYLMEYLVKDGYSSDINTSISLMKGDLVRAFASLLSDMWREGGDPSRALNTGPFKAQIQKFAPVFSGYQQHDAQEFLRKLLEGLHEDVNRVVTKPRPIMEDIQDDLDDQQKAMEAWKRYLRYDDSKIVDMFVGQLKSCLECSVCGHCSVTFDPFWDLSLPIPSKSGQVRLAQCLDLFTKEEVLDGDERPTCSKCKERRKMTKTFSIQKFPKVLVLHLKRFSPLERWRGKLSCTVEFPLDACDLSRYASSSTSNCIYNLIGVANHSGTTYSGHYTAYCRHPYSGTWHEYNDSRVSSISVSRVCSAEAYVLFYELSSASKL